jgi:2'-5' RNA ligase
MKRLFVAIDLPDQVKAQIKPLCKGIVGAKWVSDQQLHLTLRFIGDTDEKQQSLIETGLATIRATPFHLALVGLGQFPNRGQPRVLWVGLEATTALTALQKQVEAAIRTSGFSPDKPFSPHITLARFRNPPPLGSMDNYLKIHRDFKSTAFGINHFTLYSSQLTSHGSNYHIEAQYPLG